MKVLVWGLLLLRHPGHTKTPPVTMFKGTWPIDQLLSVHLHEHGHQNHPSFVPSCICLNNLSGASVRQGDYIEVHKG